MWNKKIPIQFQLDSRLKREWGSELLYLFVKIPIPFIDKHAASIFQQKKELIFYISKEIRKIQFTLISYSTYSLLCVHSSASWYHFNPWPYIMCKKEINLRECNLVVKFSLCFNKFIILKVLRTACEVNWSSCFPVWIKLKIIK